MADSCVHTAYRSHISLRFSMIHFKKNIIIKNKIMNNIMQGLGAAMAGAGPAGMGLYNSSAASHGLISPEAMHQLDMQAASRQMKGNPAGLNLRQQLEQANAYS